MACYFDSAAFADMILRHPELLAFDDETGPYAPAAWSIVVVIAGTKFSACVVRQRLNGKAGGVAASPNLERWHRSHGHNRTTPKSPQIQVAGALSGRLVAVRPATDSQWTPAVGEPPWTLIFADSHSVLLAALCRRNFHGHV
jgi:hypothetical protein